MKKKIILLFSILFICAVMLYAGEHTEPTVGVVLSGGGARGIAHIGVLRALEEYNIPINYIGGTSFGALIAAFYASGYSVDQIQEIIEKTDWSFVSDSDRQQYYYYSRRINEANVLRVRFEDWELKFPNSLGNTQEITSQLDYYFTRSNYLSRGDFLKLNPPLFISTTDIKTGTNHIFTHGELPQVVQASMTVPFLLSPVLIDSTLYVDGGITNNLPISSMRDMGADIIIASNATNYLATETDLTNISSFASQLINIMMFSKIKDELTQADIVIRPSTRHIKNTEFSRYKELLTLGYYQTYSMIDTILSVVKHDSSFDVSIDECVSIKDKKISLFGNTLFAADDMLTEEIFDSLSTLQELESYIENYYVSRGYVLVEIVKESVKEDEILIMMTEGLINNILIDGNFITHEGVILREVNTQPGDIFNIYKIEKDIQRIHGTNYFNLVNCNVNPHPNGVVDVEFVVSEKPFGIIEAGAQYASQQGASGFISAGYDNVFGTGQLLQSYIRFGRERKYGVRFSTDRILNSNWNNLLHFYLNDDAENAENRFWSFRAESGFFDDQKLGMLSLIIDYRTADLKLRKRSSGFGLQLLFDNFDNMLYPSKGIFRKASYIHYDKAFGSLATFNEVNFENAFCFSFLEKFTLVNWFRLHMLESDEGSIPENRFFFHRPENTFYGFGYDDVDGEDMFYTSISLRYLIRQFSISDPRRELFLIGKIGIGDFGKIDSMEDFWGIFDKGEKVGYSIGLEMTTIIGPVKLAYEQSKHNNFWKFSIGYSF
ncbi:MAG: patatin-like phospholipase family protein [Candidatus Cloacimonetes bacterium]|nr:patatin-like phospholipase family protein [Candidatus Cloacimonadota bacterium]